MSKTKNVLAGTAIAAAIAAAVVVFFTSTKKGQETAKKIKEYATDIGHKVSEQLQKSKTITKKKYDDIVDKVVDEYGADKKLAKNVTQMIKKDLKKRWTDVEKQSKKASKK